MSFSGTDDEFLDYTNLTGATQDLILGFACGAAWSTRPCNPTP